VARSWTSGRILGADGIGFRSGLLMQSTHGSDFLSIILVAAVNSRPSRKNRSLVDQVPDKIVAADPRSHSVVRVGLATSYQHVPVTRLREYTHPMKLKYIFKE
jgi:hypothetical protein